MYLHCLRTDSHFLLFALVLVSAVVAAAAPGIRPVQQRHSLTSTSYIPKVTLASVKFPGTATDIKSKNGLHIEAAIKRFLRKVIKSQFELGDLKDNFKFYGSPSKPDIEENENLGDNVFNNALFTQGRPMDVNLYTLAKLEGGKKRTIS
ncbi:hypothetical protein LENED_005349 [Lentinula edodes]|uniref:Uncharacterized protein n=1 Tax=Lentinula edodes TaxID=5353 RepID=A0A1Q3E8R4_LENED|nr:hypothetical protein LENED_005349 [Lentinula edodes]